MKIHLGCGDKRWPGFVNVDFKDSDIDSDIRTLPFEDGSVSEIHLIHVFEHLHRMEAPEALKEWKRVLKKGGKLVMEVPCLDKVTKHLAAGSSDFNYTLFALYGDVRLTDRPEMMHKWCYSQKEIVKLLNDFGFRNIQIEEPFFHLKERDMRVVCYT